MENKDLIIKLYFDEEHTATSIAKELNVSNAYITKIIKQDSRYYDEKKKRKEDNKKKHIDKTKKYIAKSREKKEMEYARLKQAHIQATMELSGGNKPINNRAFRNWNSSAYRYDEKRKSYILKRGIIVGADVPKQIKWY